MQDFLIFGQIKIQPLATVHHILLHSPFSLQATPQNYTAHPEKIDFFSRGSPHHH